MGVRNLQKSAPPQPPPSWRDYPRFASDFSRTEVNILPFSNFIFIFKSDLPLQLGGEPVPNSGGWGGAFFRIGKFLKSTTLVYIFLIQVIDAKMLL